MQPANPDAMEIRRRDCARELRKHMTDAERLLWSKLRLRQIIGCKFRRQAPIGNYIADFVSFEHRLIVELDDGQHNAEETAAYDRRRTTWLESQKFRVLRFWNHEVMESLDAVLEVIFRALQENDSDLRDAVPPTPPSPRKRGGS
jgi:very-short-patch-repair endonuclease